ncbi:MAG: DUF445 family protein [Desulfofustis sp.]|nr:DUF445 family protein [Desulfofustis sp.]
MLSITESAPYLVYLAPPLVGAFIGYLTNRVAIRMLFRPLKTWRIGRLKIPMTPGVIPSKRHQLADNIGEMVGEHLLTSDEISNSLQREAFQEHLQNLIESSVASTMKKDLGSLKTIIPPTYRTYFDIAVKTTSYQIKERLHTYLRGDDVSRILEEAVESWIDMVLASRIDNLVPADQQGLLTARLIDAFIQMVHNPATETQLASRISEEIISFTGEGGTCADLLPENIREAILEAVRDQTPRLLKQAARLLEDPEVKNRLVEALIEAIEEFVETLGPMSNMVKGFLKRELLDQKIKEYLDDKQEGISSFFQDHYIEIRVRAALGERLDSVLAAPLSGILRIEQTEELDTISELISKKFLGLLDAHKTRQMLGLFLQAYFTQIIAGGEQATGKTIEKIIGAEPYGEFRVRLRELLVGAFYSPETTRFVDRIVDDLSEQLVNKPIGRLDHLIPKGVAVALCTSLREMTTRLLISEVPGIVKSLNIRKIVTDRIDSFDLLRLEQLLLSIMAEQFKYINLFGALLGFIIGCANLLFMIGAGR